MRPAFRLLAGGADITANIKDRLLSLTYHDEAETKSDRLTIKLDDRPNRETGAHVALPVMGTKLALSLGYEETGMVAMGSFIVDDIKYNGAPATLEVGAKAADMAGPFRSPTSKSWNDTTLGAIAGEIAEAHGYKAKVAPTLGAVPVAHEDQTNESPMAFLNRLAAKHDGIAKPVNGFLVLAPKGTAKSVTGQSLPALSLRPERLSKWQIQVSARKEAGEAAKTEDAAAGSGGGVRTRYWDKDKARMVEVTEGKPPYQNTRFAWADAKDAKANAASEKNRKDREKAKFSASGVGDPRFQAEQRLTLVGFRPGLPTDWRVTKVEHKLENGGYSCSIDAEMFHENQADVASKSRQ
ncbi:phage late control D family protein [Azospirillum doebereinerae]